MNKLKEHFTKWYVNKGYLFRYDFTDNPTESSFICPIWVRPFLIFFSPNVYFNETYGKIFLDGLCEGFKAGEEALAIVDEFEEALEAKLQPWYKMYLAMTILIDNKDTLESLRKEYVQFLTENDIPVCKELRNDGDGNGISL